MIKPLLAVALISSSLSASYAQYCTAVGPATPDDSNLQSLILNGESGTGISFTGCPGVVGLDDQTLNETVLLNAGSSYTASLVFGTCGGSFYGVGEGWIDYNQNGIFEATESLGTWSGNPPVATNWNFTVPAGAISGTTRMRVVHYEGGMLPIDPCATFTWGSTTDFTVFIGGGMDCSGYVGQNTSDPRIVSALPYSENHDNSVCYYNIMTVYGSPDVFYRILPQQLGAAYLTVSLCGSSFDTYLSIIDENDNVLWYNDDNTTCGTGSKIHFPAGSHDTLYAVVQGYGTAMGTYSIQIEQELAELDTENKPEISVYPNPANDNLWIQSGEVLNYSLVELSGKVAQSGQADSHTPIPVSQLARGTYLLILSSESFVWQQKITLN